MKKTIKAIYPLTLFLLCGCEPASRPRLFKEGDMVAYKADTNIIGIIIKVQSPWAADYAVRFVKNNGLGNIFTVTLVNEYEIQKHEQNKQ